MFNSEHSSVAQNDVRIRSPDGRLFAESHLQGRVTSLSGTSTVRGTRRQLRKLIQCGNRGQTLSTPAAASRGIAGSSSRDATSRDRSRAQQARSKIDNQLGNEAMR